jgi:hypothetical protein
MYFLLHVIQNLDIFVTESVQGSIISATISTATTLLLWHGASGFTSPPKKSLLLILSSIKVHRLGRV